MLSEREIFASALAIENPAERESYLKQVCGDDVALRARLDAELNRAFYQPPGATADLEKAPGLTGDSMSMAEKPVLSADVVGRLIGNYKLLQKIGEGGFGVVYMAEQLQPVRRNVALKIIKPGMDTRAVVARFEAERQALAMMDHTNIAKVFDGGTIDDRPYFVMELVKGIPITGFCDKNHLSVRDRLKLFSTVCQAVQHAHQKGIIHRDIKPSNVMVTLHDGQPVVKVIDFGVAKAVHQRLTERTMFTEYGQMIGTPQYMSPEQAEMSGLDIDTRSDIYSLGVLLYELLTGSTPLEGQRLRTAGYVEMQRLIREEEPARPSHRLSTTGDELTVIARHRSVSAERLHREISGDLDWIVMKSLEKDRQRRYVTAREFEADIQRLLNDEPIEARPPSVTYRASKWLRKYRAIATVVSVIILTLAGASIATSLGMLRAIKAEGENAKHVVQLKKDRQHLVEISESNRKLAATAETQRIKAEDHEKRAKQQTIQSESIRLAAVDAARQLESNPGLALALSSFAAERAIERNSYHNTVLLESLRNCRELKTYDLRPLFGDGGNVPMPIAIYPLGQSSRVAICFYGGMPGVVVFDLQTAKEVCRFGMRNASFDFTAVDSNGKLLATVHTGTRDVAWRNGRKHIYSGRAIRLWDLESGKEIAVLRGHTNQVVSLDFNRDGTRLVSASWDGTTRIWDVATGKELAVLKGDPVTFTQHLEGETVDVTIPLPVIMARFSPDGSRVLTVDAGQQLSCRYPEPADYEIDPPYYAREGEIISDGNTGGISFLGLPDGVMPAVRLWNPNSNSLDAEHRLDNQKMLGISAGFLPGGNQFAILSETETMQRQFSVHQVGDGAPVGDIQIDNDYNFRFDAKVFQASMLDAELLTWARDRSGHWSFSKAQSAVLLNESPVGGSGRPRLESSLYGMKNDQPFDVDIRQNRMTCKNGGRQATSKGIALLGHIGEVGAVNIMSDGRLVSCDTLGLLRIWNWNEIADVPRELNPVDLGLSDDQWAPVGWARFVGQSNRLLITENRAIVFGPPVTSSQYRHGDSGGPFLNAAHLLDPLEPKLIRSFKPNPPPAQNRNSLQIFLELFDGNSDRQLSLGELVDIDISPDGKRLMTVHKDYNIVDDFDAPIESHPSYQPVRVWSVESGEQLFALNGFRNTVAMARFDASGDRIATLESDSKKLRTPNGDSTIGSNNDYYGGIELWDANNGGHLRVLHRFERSIPFKNHLLWRPATTQLLFHGDHTESCAGMIIDTETGGEVVRLEGRPTEMMEFSMDGRFAAGSDGSVWSIPGGKRIWHLQSPGNSAITSLATRPNAAELLTTHKDGNACVWDLETGKPRLTLVGHQQAINTGQFSPDGKWIVTAAYNDNVRVWNADSGVEWIQFPTPFPTSATFAIFSPDSQFVLTGGAASVGHLWPIDPMPLALAKRPRELTDGEIQRFEANLLLELSSGKD